VCRTLSCALLGAECVTAEIASQLGIGVGETDRDGMFTLVEVECLGACDRGPVVMVNDAWHECQTAESVGSCSTACARTARSSSAGVTWP